MDGGVAQRSTRRDRKRERHDYERERELSKYSKNERENSFYFCRLGILYTAVSGVWRGAPTLCPVRSVPLSRAPRRGPGVGGVPWVYDTLCRSAVWMQNGVSEYTTAAVRIRIRGVERRITAAIGGEVGMRTCSPRRLDEMSNRQGRHPYHCISLF